MEIIKTFFADLIFTSPLMGIGWMGLFALFVSSAIIFNAWFRRYPMFSADLKTQGADIWTKTKKYVPNALWQQALFVTLFFWLNRALGWEIATVLSALIFGMVFHQGNPALMGWVSGMGVVYGIFYNHYHNVYILVLVHGYLATILHSYTLPEFNQGFVVLRRE